MLTLTPGELVVLTGEDGCGTSMLLRSVAGTLLDAPPGSEWSMTDVVVASGPLSALGGDHLVGRTLETMSNGERQRVRLARLVSFGGPVLLLDDGLGCLDLPGVGQALQVLRAAADAGAVVVLVAKGHQRAFDAADRVLTLAGGRLTPYRSGA